MGLGISLGCRGSMLGVRSFTCLSKGHGIRERFQKLWATRDPKPAIKPA